MVNAKNQNDRIIFGLKVKELRQAKNLSFADLSETSGLSISYLNEIEKGKKFPKPNKIRDLAGALGVSAEDLSTPNLVGPLAPVGDLLKSNFLNELPLDLFGIELSKVVEIIANAPLRVGAFISTLVELSRNYYLGEEHFYMGALRAYQEMHYNYFDDLEATVDNLVSAYELPTNRVIRIERLERLLLDEWGVETVRDGLGRYPELGHLRAVYHAKAKKLLLNNALDDMQIRFQIVKEIGFQYMQIDDRSMTSIYKVKTFDQVLNHFKATYFANALLIDRNRFISDVSDFFRNELWDGEAFIALMNKYDASPEMLYGRLTNILPKYFGLKELFFLRFYHDREKDTFQVDKELHLDRHHHPHGNQLNEHYCRRWMSLSLLKELNQMQETGRYAGTVVGAQRSAYLHTDDEYLCITLGRPGTPQPDKNVSVTMGFLITDELKNRIEFWDDPHIVQKEVHTTCERCSLTDCKERVAPATIIERRTRRKYVAQALDRLNNSK